MIHLAIIFSFDGLEKSGFPESQSTLFTVSTALPSLFVLFTTTVDKKNNQVFTLERKKTTIFSYKWHKTIFIDIAIECHFSQHNII